MDETNQVKGRIMEDTYLVAFLAMKGHIVIPFIRDGDKAPDGFARVAFDVQGDVDRTVNLYYANMDVGVRDSTRPQLFLVLVNYFLDELKRV